MFKKLVVMCRAGLKAIAEEDNPPAHPPSVESVRAGFEVKDANGGAILFAAIALVTVGLVIQLVISRGFSHFKHGKMDVDQPTVIPPVDFSEEKDPTRPLSQYRAEMDHILHTYDWVDRNKKTVRVPIERAMERIAHEK